MRSLIHLFSKNHFIASGSVLFSGSIVVSVLNYLFNLIMGRMLAPAEYGSVAALVTLSMLVAAPAMAVNLFMGSRISEYTALSQDNAAFGLYSRVARFASLTGVVVGIAFIASVPVIGGFLNIESFPLLLFGMLLVVSLASSATNGTLQGLSQFSNLSISQILSALGKFLFSIAFVALGFSVSGTVLAMIIGASASYLFARSMIKKRFAVTGSQAIFRPHQAIQWNEIANKLWTQFGPVFLATIFISLFQNVDVLLAKHVLPAHQAGEYSALAVLGRIITYGSAAIVTVLLPSASASRASNDGKLKQHLKTALLICSGIALVGTFVFFTFPELIVGLLFGATYSAVTPFLPMFGLAMALGSVAMVFVHYSIATKSKTFLYPFGLAVVVLVAGVSWFGQTMGDIVRMQLIANSVFLFGMVWMRIFEKDAVDNRM